jgi:hypothetical protein
MKPKRWRWDRFDWGDLPYERLDDILEHELVKEDGDYHLKVAIDADKMIKVYQEVAEMVLNSYLTNRAAWDDAELNDED